MVTDAGVWRGECTCPTQRPLKASLPLEPVFTSTTGSSNFKLCTGSPSISRPSLAKVKWINSDLIWWLKMHWWLSMKVKIIVTTTCKNRVPAEKYRDSEWERSSKSNLKRRSGVLTFKGRTLFLEPFARGWGVRLMVKGCSWENFPTTATV
jgi:hypothetical protein